MTFAAAIPALIQAAASVGGGFLASKNSGKQTKTQKKQNKLIDQLMASLNGNGPFGDLFNFNEENFKKSFIDPAKSIFKNQIAPQIQQSYIAGGQQRGSGIEDQLLRAGVDLDQLLNQHMAQAQENALNRKQNAINSILGAGSGGAQAPSNSQAFGEGVSGYLSSDAFSDSLAKVTNEFNKKKTETQNRKGFENDDTTY